MRGAKREETPNSRIRLKEIVLSINVFSVASCSYLTSHILLEKDVVAKHLAQPLMNKTDEYYIKHCQKQGRKLKFQLVKIFCKTSVGGKGNDYSR